MKCVMKIIGSVIAVLLVLSFAITPSLWVTSCKTKGETGGSQTTTNRNDVIIALGVEPQSGDPHVVSVAANYPLQYPIFDHGSAFRGNLLIPNSGGEDIANLAEKWQLSSDGLTIEFWLRKGVKFHDGSTMTAADVKYSLERVKRTDLQPSQTYWSSIDSVEIVDDYTVKVHLNKIDISLLSTPANGRIVVVPKNYVERVGDKGFADNPIGTGPYKFVEWKKGEYFVLQAFEDYWGGAPKIKTARYVIAPEDLTRVAMLRTGEADIAPIPPSLAANIQITKGLEVNSYASQYGIAINFNTREPPFDNTLVRQAVEYAIDRDAIVENLLYGYGTPATPLMPGQFAYESDKPYSKPWPYDPVKAKQLLDQAGYPNGLDVEFVGLASGRIASSPQVAQAVSSYLGKIGIRCNLVIQDYNTMIKTYMNGWKNLLYAMYDLQGPAGYEPITELKNCYLKDSLFGKWDSPETDILVNQIPQTIDATKRADLWHQVIAKLWDEAATCWLYAEKVPYGQTSALRYNPEPGDDGVFFTPQHMSWK
jgi:peptide/nickel transport system substrate-binding protein